MIIDSESFQILCMMLVSALAILASYTATITGSPALIWRGTSICMFLFAAFNLLIDPVLDLETLDNQFLLGLFNFLCGSFLWVFGSKEPEVKGLTLAIAWLFYGAMALELLVMFDIENRTDYVYSIYHNVIEVLNACQMILIGGGIYYGRISNQDPRARRTFAKTVLGFR